MIIEYAVPSLAQNYPCKKYHIIYESVSIYLCTCMRNKYPRRSEFVWNVHIQVMLKVISFSIPNMVAGGIVFEIPRQTIKCTLSCPNELIICPDIHGSKFQSKFRVLDVKQKTSLFYVQGKSAWALFHGFCSFALRHLCPVLKVNDQTPTTVILGCVAGVRKGRGRELRARDLAQIPPSPFNACHAGYSHSFHHLLHKFIVNVK